MSAAAPHRVPWGFMAAVGVGLLILVTLGTWQLHRRDVKEAYIARVEAGMAAEAVDLPAALERWRSGADVDFMQVRVAGRYQPGPQFRLFSQLQGVSGWQLVAVLASNGGPAVLVDRGFVPDELKDSEAADLPAGSLEFTGILRRHRAEQGLFTPDNDAAGNQWFWWDTGAMAIAAGLVPGDLPAFVIQRTPQAGDPDWPRAVATGAAAIPNNHLQYALTWYALAMVLAVMAFIFARTGLRPPDRHDNQRDE